MTMNEMLLRGCMLKNSNYVLGLVVYTGKESRIQMNAAATPNKVGEMLKSPHRWTRCITVYYYEG